MSAVKAAVKVACSVCGRAKLVKRLSAGLACAQCLRDMQNVDCFGDYLGEAECQFCFDRVECKEEP